MDQVVTIGIDTLIMAIAGILGSAGIWNFLSKRSELKAKKEKERNEEFQLYRDDLRERVAVLESKLLDERSTNDQLRKLVSDLKEEVAEYKTRLEFLESENARLKIKAREHP
jgi:predicted RNase H-like nuclease (RuvC/YqgF family)